MGNNIDRTEQGVLEDGFISLPVRREALGDFVSSLLGQPQSISTTKKIHFDIELNWLINLHELVHQRITQQSQASLTHFSIAVELADGFSRTLTSPESLRHYTETKSSFPKSVKVVWIYLVNFPAKPHPEKQQISFSARVPQYESKTNSGNLVDMILRKSFRSLKRRGEISLQIETTERTWGDDLESVADSHIEKIIKESSTSDIFYDAFSLIFFLSLPFVVAYYFNFFDSLGISKLSSALEAAKFDYKNLESVNEKINAILHYVSFRTEGLVPISLKNMIGLIFLTYFSLIIYYFTKRRKYSYLAITSYAIKHREKMLKAENKRTMFVILSFIISVGSGIVASFIFGRMGG